MTDFGLPRCERALVLSPHPDDEALGPGGTILRLNAAGAVSRVVFLTDGERLYGDPNPEVAEKRRDEGVRSSALLGCREPFFLGFPDGRLASCTQEVCRRLSGIIAEERPDIVFAPSPIDHHPDHIATAGAALSLLESEGGLRLAFYEVYSTLRFTHLIEVTDVVERKKEAILTYRTSLYGNPHLYLRAALGLNAHRALFVQSEGFYEALYIVENTGEADTLPDRLCYKDLQPGRVQKATE